MSSLPYFYNYLTTKRLDMLDWELNFNARVIFQSLRRTSHLSTGCKGHVFLLVPLSLAMSFIRSMKTNVLTLTRIQEFGEESKQQKLLVDLLVMEKQVHPDIDGGHNYMLEVGLFRQIRSLIMSLKCYFMTS